jgi:hypothetical protein
MLPEDRRRAEFFAQVASLTQLDGIATSHAAKLVEDLLELGYHWLSDHSSIRARLLKINPLLTDEDLNEQKIEGFRQVLPLVALHDVQKYSRKLILDLLDNRRADLSSIEPLRGTVLVLDADHRRVAIQAKEPDSQNEMLVT